MANEAEQLSYELTATADKFKAAFNDATKSANDNFSAMEARGKEAGDRMAESIKGATASIADSFRSLEGPAKTTGDRIGAMIGGGIIAGAAGIATVLTELINTLASAGDRAADLRLPINIIQALSVAADEARVPTTMLNMALDTFTSVSKKATDDAKKFYQALNAIGPSFSKAFQSAGTQGDRLRILMNALHSTGDEAARANLMVQAFGSDNQRLTGIFAAGSGALEDYIEEVRKLGLEIDESAVKKAQEAKSALSLLARVMDDELSSSLASLIPSFKEFLPLLESVAGYVRDTVAGYASAENRPLATLRNDAQAAGEHIADLQQQLKDLDNYKPATGIVGGIAGKLGVDVETSHDDKGEFAGVAVNIEDARKKIQDEIASTQSALDQYKKLIEEKQKIQDSQKGHDGAEAPAFKPRPKLKDDNGDTKDAYDHAVESINKHRAALEAEQETIGQTADKVAGLKAELQLLEAAQRSGDSITQQQIDSYAKLRESMGQQQALASAGVKLNEQQGASFASATAGIASATKNLDDAKKHFQAVQEAGEFFATSITDAFENIVVSGKSLQSQLQPILQSLEKNLLTGVLTGGGAFGGLFGTAPQGGAKVGGLFGGLLGLFGGARAEGGDVSAGKAYLVGERGPEILAPKSAGRIIPNHQISGGAGRNTTNHNYNSNVTINGSAGGDHQANQSLAEKIGKQVTVGMRSMVGDEISRQIRNGGILSRGQSIR